MFAVGGSGISAVVPEQFEKTRSCAEAHSSVLRSSLPHTSFNSSSVAAAVAKASSLQFTKYIKKPLSETFL
jgi:hypothetical protein